MQNFLLPFCEKIVLNELKQQRELYPQPDRMYYMRTLSELRTEKIQAVDAFHRLAFELKDESQTTWAIRSYQEKIVFLADQVAMDMTNDDILTIANLEEPETTWINLCKSILHMLLELLGKVEYYFVKYIELDGRIPIAYLVFARHRFDMRLTSLSTALTVAGVSDPMQEFIRHPFREFLCEDDGCIITYQRLFYLNSLMYELCSIFPVAGDAGNIDARIQEKLRELNYNHPDFFAFCTSSIKAEVESLPAKERLEHLIWMRKEVNQMQHKHGMTYNRFNDSLKQQLQMWLTEEINYLKDVGELPTTDDTAGGRWKGFKVETQFSVPQMGYCIKLLCDTGMFTNLNKTELLDFFSEFFASVKQPQISARSLRKNFYNDDASAAAGVRDILINLLNQSKKGLSVVMIGAFSFCDFIFYLPFMGQ